MWRKENGWVLLMVDIHARLCIHNPKPWNWRFHAARWLLSSVWDGGSLTQKVLSQLLFALARLSSFQRTQITKVPFSHVTDYYTCLPRLKKKKKDCYTFITWTIRFFYVSGYSVVSIVSHFLVLYIRKLIKFWLT